MLASLSCKYLIYGREVGAKLTPHLQGFIVFDNALTLVSAIKKLQGCHVEVAKGSVAQNVAYCSKDGLVTELGIKPLSPTEKGDTEKERWTKIIQAAKDDDQEWLKVNEPRFWAEGQRTICSIQQRCRPEAVDRRDLDNWWFWGPTGTGKSRRARDENPGAYVKDPTTKWWDGYEGQDCVIIDDFDKYQVSMGHLFKRWFDHYPFDCEKKGLPQYKIRPKKMVVTSNYPIEAIWGDDETLKPMIRRFTVVKMDSVETLYPELFSRGFNPGRQARVATPPLDYSHNSDNCTALDALMSYGQVNLAVFDPDFK